MLSQLIRLVLACSQGINHVSPPMSILNNPNFSSHLPLMFVGMEHIMLSNYALADEALNAAHSMCDGDPLLINERGVMAYNHEEYVVLIYTRYHRLTSSVAMN